jgi:phage shock protein PspC (stress-responsive transcriptional regulator)
VLAGVCAGLARYFAIDPVLVRVLAVGLVAVGGVGVVLYAAAWLLVPDDAGPDGAGVPRRSAAALVGGAVLVLIAVAVLGIDPFWSPQAVFGPFVVLLLLAAFVWWLVRNRGGRMGPRLAHLLVVLAVLLATLASVGIGFWVTGLGGGQAMAATVVVAGLALVGAAFAGGARWLVAPALALAVGVGVATAADLDLRGDYGERTERVTSLTRLPAAYDIGAGSLTVDLRDAPFPPGERRLRVELGLGEAEILVPGEVCVVADAHVGVGELRVMGDERHGVDLTIRDAPATSARRLVVDAEVGMGSLRILNAPDRDTGPGPDRDASPAPVVQPAGCARGGR